MATKRFRGDAQPVAQVDSLTVGGTIEVGDVFTVTINGKTVSIIAATTVVATTATAIYTALAASTIPEFTEITWTNPSAGVVYGTGADDGKPFTVTATTTETGGGAADTQTFVRASVTAPSGPNWWSVAANWSDGAVPVSTDEVDLIDCDVDILYGLDQNAVTLARLTRWESFTGKVGLPDYDISAGANAAYFEYREKSLKISATLLDIHPSRAGRFRINTGSVQTTCNIYGTGDADDSDTGAVQIDGGTNASNLFQIVVGTVDLAMGSGQTVTAGQLKIGYESSQESDARVRCGSGCTLTAVVKNGGELHTYGAVVAGTQYAGDWHHYAGGFTAPIFHGGTLYYRSTDDLDTPIFTGDAVLDCSRDLRAREIISAAFHGSSYLLDPSATVTWTNGIDFVQREVGERNNFGRNRNLTIAGA